MVDNESVTAVVPARGGSKRFPNKNMSKFLGRELLFRAVDCALESELVDDCVVTTDSDEYLQQLEREYRGKAVKLVSRPSEFATDTTKVFHEVLRLIETNAVRSKWLVLLLPTSPGRTPNLIDTMIRTAAKVKKDVFTACEYDFPIDFAFRQMESNGKQLGWTPVFDDSPMLTGNTRSQDLPTAFRPIAAGYVIRTTQLHLKTTFYQESVPFFIKFESSFDIDTQQDLSAAELNYSQWEKN